MQAAAAVLHPNVLPIYNVESDGKLPYLVMQYVHGLSLEARVRRDGPLDVASTLRIAKQTAAGLAAAHAQGLVHRDVKPANILLEEEVQRASLTDFGLARTVDDASLTRTGIVAGTPHYMSPEQANGDSIDARSDLFSLGSVIYFMLAGHPPFRAEAAMAVLNRICHHPHRPVHESNIGVPRELSRLIDRLLAKTPEQRFQRASEVESALDDLLSALQKGGLRITHSRNSMPSKRRRTMVAALVVIALASISVAAWQNRVLHPSVETAAGNSQPSALAAGRSEPSALAAGVEGNRPESVYSPQRQSTAHQGVSAPTVRPLKSSSWIPAADLRDPRLASMAHSASLPMILPNHDDGWHELAQETLAELDAFEQPDASARELRAVMQMMQSEWQQTTQCQLQGTSRLQRR